MEPDEQFRRSPQARPVPSAVIGAGGQPYWVAITARPALDGEVIGQAYGGNEPPSDACGPFRHVRECAGPRRHDCL